MLTFWLVLRSEMPLPNRMFRLLFLALFLSWTTAAFAQEPAKKPDEAAPADTVKKGTSSERILKGLQEYSKRKSLPARLVRELFNFKKKKDPEVGLDPGMINYAFAEHDYKVVRRIEIRTLDPFGYSITDSTRLPKNALERTANSIHIKTHKSRVRNKLLFKVGEQLEPQALIESERLLRQTEHILDARVRVNEKTSTPDSVDIIVITKDVFSISGSGAYNTHSTLGIISLRDVNFLGLGHHFRNKLWLGIDDRPQSWQYQGGYTLENIYRTYITADFIYNNDYYTDQRGFSFSRWFYSNNTKYAGGVAVYWYKNRTFFYDSTQNLQFNTKDVWLARAYKLKSYTLGSENPGRLIVGGRILNYNYTAIPPETSYLNTTLYLGSVGYSYRKYYKDKYLFGFGRTEDIPAGNLITLTLGYEYATTRIRQYTGVKATFGKYRKNFGYLYGGAEFGSFIHKGKWMQGVINVDALYFTKLYNLNGWLIRNYIWNRLTYGFNREPYEYLTINNVDGIRGFRSGTLTGQSKYSLNIESNVFTPISFVGFNLAAIAFADISWLSSVDNKSPFKSKPYQGFGIGIRFRNEYMAFSTIQLIMAYYPRIPPGESFNHLKFYESSRRYYDFQNFNYAQPATAEYK